MKRKIYSLFLIVVILSVVLSISNCSLPKRDRPFNIVLISLDTVRYDALGYTGNASAQTPNIDALSKQGMIFTGAISTNSLTTPAHSSLFTGRYPTAHGIHTNGIYALPESEYTLAEFLKEHGFITAGFASAFPVSHRFGLSQGFDYYNDRISLPEQEQKAKFRMGAFAQRSAEDLANAVISWIKEDLPRKKPFFLFIHFFDAHAPYSPPPHFIERFGTSKKQRYAAEIAYIDSQLGKILASLEELEDHSRTIFIVMSDHGESLGEHGEETHGIFIYDSTIRIPLFLTGGPILQGETFHGQVGIIDIFPTIVALLGLPQPESLHGISLKGTLLGSNSHRKDNPYYVESFLSSESFGWSPLIGFRKPTEKFISAPRPEFYDLKEDPAELNNLYHQRHSEVEDLKKELTALVDNITEVPIHAYAQLSGEELDILHSLGYIGAGIETTDLGSRVDPKDRIFLFRKMEEARLQIHSGDDIDSALAQLKKLEQEDSSNLTLRLTIGQTLLALERHQEAEDYFFSLISDNPHFYPALNELGNLSLRREAWVEAADYYRKSLDRNAIQMELYPNLVHALSQMNLMEDAIAVIDSALNLAPEDPVFHSIRGELAMQENDLVSALMHFSVAFSADPQDISAASNYARTLLLSDQASEALTVLRPFEMEGGGNIDFQLLYGQCLAQAGHVREGAQRFEKVLAMKDHPSAHYFLGLCHLKMGNKNEAEKHFNRLAKDDPNFKKSREALEAFQKGRM